MELGVSERKAEVGKLPSRCLCVRAPSSLRVVLPRRAGAGLLAGLSLVGHWFIWVGGGGLLCFALLRIGELQTRSSGPQPAHKASIGFFFLIRTNRRAGLRGQAPHGCGE